ncbi:MAG: hypothetical protein H0V30_06625 [Chitinophagaceae bacterium]|nr:hypothetical protein [Chitinophagaceae bacterium]
MKFLLPHRFKIIGTIIAPLGFGLWLAMQSGLITKVLVLIFGGHLTASPYHIINVAVAIISFFSFLLGIFFLTFSRENIEDEMVQRTRLDSFQVAALGQIIVIIAGFVFMLFNGDPGESGMMVFFIILVFQFWLSFIIRFNYILHVKYRQ